MYLNEVCEFGKMVKKGGFNIWWFGRKKVLRARTLLVQNINSVHKKGSYRRNVIYLKPHNGFPLKKIQKERERSKNFLFGTPSS
jgi:hypothetical protein